MLWKPQKMVRLLHVKTLKPAVKSAGTIVDKMREMGMLGDLPLSDQMSLLDFM